MWLGLSISFSFLFACYMQLYYVRRSLPFTSCALADTAHRNQQGSVTLHHTVIITLLSHLPYISTLAGMNTLTSCA